MKGPRSVPALLAVASLVMAAGCARQVTRTLVPPAAITTLDERSPYLKVHLANGGLYVLRSWQVDSARAALAGTGVLLNADRQQVGAGDFRIPADSVALFETNVVSTSGPAKALTVMAGITAAVAGVCAASPKTCFGSCPTFYAPDVAGEMRLEAEGFSSSIAPALEATDIDMLLHTRPASRDYSLRLTNEAFETHVIRRADILALRRPGEGRIYLTSDGRFLEGGTPIQPVRCTAPEGDCRASLATADGKERTSTADSTDLAAREIIELAFDEAPEGRLGVVVTSRQTLMTTFLLYQALAYMGHDAGRWLAALATGGEEAVRRAQGVGEVLGGIEVLAEDRHGHWHVVGSVGETGPIATDTRVVPLPPHEGRGRVTVRLRLTQGLWRLDRVALVSLGGELQPIRIAPVAVQRDGQDDPAALRALVEPEETLVTLPGDVLRLVYRLPEEPERYELFLEARGYYLEWMRREWFAEEDPLRAAQLLMDPARAMRALAPAFKREEPRIEALFWGSRYVRH